MEVLLELSDQEFKTIMINMLRVRMDKVDSTQKQMENKQRDGNHKKEPNINARNQKH